MNQDSEHALLDDVLNAYAISDPEPGYVSLAEWVRRYPYYEQELTAFAADWALFKWLPNSTNSQSSSEDTLVLRGMNIVQNILHQQVHPSEEKMPPLKGLVQEGARLGLSPNQLVERTQMSTSLVRKLDRRLIRSASIPQQAIEALANALHCTSSAIIDYLQGGAFLPQGASYRSEQAPTLADPEDFFEAVRRDMMLPQELRDHWLSFALPDTSEG